MHSRREFVNRASLTSMGLAVLPSLASGAESSTARPPAEVPPVWRNRQPNMHYRSLGRTGMMVSELVLGTFPFETEASFPLFDEAIRRGINYFDCAAAYSGGAVEANLGRYLKATGNRGNMFLSTKLSAYYGMIDGLLKKELGKTSKAVRAEIEAKAQRMIERRRVTLPGYYVQYFGGQARQFDKTYFRYFAMQEVGIADEWRNKIKANARRLLAESMERLQTDHLDVLHIPHGVAMPEMMDGLLRELFAEFKEQGKVKAAAVSFHNDVTGNLLQATKVGYYDVAMFAYNIANHAGLEHAVWKANQTGMGLIAMKVAKLFSMKDRPPWILPKLDATVEDESLSPFAKSYLWALQNPNLSCCVSQMETVDELNDNLQVIGRKLDLG